jgi:protein disulfide-isomerase
MFSCIFIPDFIPEQLQEKLLAAYFTEGKNVADRHVLLAIGQEIGMDPVELKSVLASDQYSKEVYEDIHTAQQFGIRGVPFFVFDRKYAVSGAQDSQVFLDALEKSWAG